ncbi:MAG: agmatine deiminase family protein [Bacteroidetes bacterium]|uniref:Agmatine deiminase family protein n=1 Tax=Candidatus Caccoplasma merdipullorum TaxID=2840718 RepID=A0A9D9E2N7_9BACT|nr:agmatine deiminase family protein [Candidatus Caccoplasma merdipullorum]
MKRYILPPEWAEQSGIQLTWPHKDTDWNYMLDEVTECYVRIAVEISRREKLLIVTPHPEDVERLLEGKACKERIRYVEAPTDDTWARDHGGITVYDGDTRKYVILDFGFNGWGNKFRHSLDNAVTRRCFSEGVLDAGYEDNNDFILEGGSIECDGDSTLMTTTECLMSQERNPALSRGEIEARLKKKFGVSNIIWLEHGRLEGDDTDGHIDTLARFAPDNTILYVRCSDAADTHYEELAEMEKEILKARNIHGEPYRTIPLPMADAVFADGERLPATYANFLIMNGAVLYPTYSQSENDRDAAVALSKAFPGYEIVGIDCLPLIKQHGSLHCITMQYPKGVLKPAAFTKQNR